MCEHILSEEALEHFTSTDFKDDGPLILNYTGPRTLIRTKFLNKDVKTPVVVIVKTLRVREETREEEEEDSLKELTNELRVWRLLDPDPNIAHFLGAGQLDEWPFNHLSLVSKYYEYGDSNKFLEKHDLPDLQRVHLLKDVLRGIAHIHGKSIVHGDLKGTNVLIENNGDAAKISDFGSSLIDCQCYAGPEDQSGTYAWDAPERFEGKKASTQSDIWAFGCTALEMLMDMPPYDGVEYRRVLNRMARGDIPASPNEIILDGAVRITVWKLMLDCWNFESSERPSATELLLSLEEIRTEAATG